MNGIINWSLAHARTVMLTLCFLLVAGTVSFVSIPKESSPDINIPLIYVSMSYTGISPEDSERLLLRPVELEVRTIEGIKEMRSTAYQGGGNIVLEFSAGFDADQALADVREKVDIARAELPDGVEEPRISEVNFSLFPVVSVVLSGDVPERTLMHLARELRDRVEGIDAVLSATIRGNREELVEIIVDPVKVESYGLDATEIAQLFSRSNRLVAAGSLDTGQGRFAVKVPGLFETVEDIWNMPVKVQGDAVVRFRDIAEIRRTFKDAESYARLDGDRAVALDVSKRTGENIIDTIERVRAVVAAEQAYWPANVVVSYTGDQSGDIKMMLNDLGNNLAITVLLVMVIVVASLGVRTSVLVGIAVPGSFLTAILVLHGMGYSINIVVLFGLILAAGNVVDGSIVVTEYADRKMADGMSPKRAYGLAARRMAWPIIASTATQLAVFAPLLLWPGVVGEFMKFLPISQFATLMAALAMALIFIPVLGARFGRAHGPVLPYAPANQLADEDESDPVDPPAKLEGPYVALLRWALARPGTVILATIGLLIGAQAWYATHGNGVEFFASVEPDNAAVLVHARGNMSIDERDVLVRQVEARILQLNEFDSVYSRTSGDGNGGGGGDDAALDVIGQIQLDFKDWQQRRKADAILEDIRKRTADLPGIQIEVRKQEGGPPTGKALQVELSSRFPDLLPAAAAHVRRGMESLGQVIDIEDSRPLPGIEWQVAVDRAQAAKFGLDTSAVGDAVRMVTNGLILSTYRPDDTDDEIDVVVRYPTEYRSIDRIDAVRVVTSAGSVPISNFVTVTPEQKVSQVDRVDGERVMRVKAAVTPGTLPDTKLTELKAWLAKNPVDPRVDVNFKGQDEEQKESQTFLTNAFLAGMVIMAIILVTQFNSLYSAFLILSSVIMSTIGVTLGLIITGQPFSIVMTGLGIISLAGIVVQNNIVLIDTYDQYRKTEASAYDAILRTGAERLRPVLLTALNTVLGLLPLCLGVNIDVLERAVTVDAPATQWWTAIANAIVFGLTFATLLTLVVTPCALMLRAHLHDWRVARKGGKVAVPPVSVLDRAAE
ncbi:efflux RND transporter permease subunit [Niveispirillum cyanobacteriorum]|uniref:MFS transporter n=1 Tax=Niveispirillum cyanobacteriorum TaxID=1612173 RepID=A0A2K9NLB2_9PROT|nr:efflux RND transporter permease subunit [Niveispirillum cyanobacteriorum]AUN33852.1 MFS transporter [Niveispirillum cyanobacteriorum]GGE81865.1 acriflavin resistance protein [Niveispirillum cyanobacteriorum]